MKHFVIACAVVLTTAGVALACETSDGGSTVHEAPPEVISPGPYPQETATSLASDIEAFVQEWVSNLNAAEYQAMWESYECQSRSFESFLDIIETNGNRMRPVEVSDIREFAFSGDKAAAVVSVKTANVDLHKELVALQVTEAGIKMIGYGGLTAEPCETIMFPGSS